MAVQRNLEFRFQLYILDVKSIGIFVVGKLAGYIVAVLALFFSPCAVASDSGEKLPFRSEVLTGYDEDEVKARCDATDLQAIEGMWYYPDEKMTIVIERCNDALSGMVADYRLVLVSAADMSLLPGTVIGYCTRSAERSKFRMWLYSEQCEDVLENPQMCVASLNEEKGELLVERSELRVKVRVNFSRFLPQLLRGISIVPSKDEVKVPEGFRKIYPATGTIEKGVRYL